MANQEHLTKKGFLKIPFYVNYLNKPLRPEIIKKYKNIWNYTFLALPLRSLPRLAPPYSLAQSKGEGGGCFNTL